MLKIEVKIKPEQSHNGITRHQAGNIGKMVIWGMETHATSMYGK
jgi:hypothetical protein